MTSATITKTGLKLVINVTDLVLDAEDGHNFTKEELGAFVYRNQKFIDMVELGEQQTSDPHPIEVLFRDESNGA
jgi:hypothetical protein